LSKAYFATLPANELVAEVTLRIDRWNRYVLKQGLASKWRQCYDTYYGKHQGEIGAVGTGNISSAGENGELATVSVNHFRNLIKHVLAITTDQKPAYDPRAINSDLDSLQQAELAKNILDAYLVEKRMGRDMKAAAERAIALSKGYVYMRWDPSLGEKFGVQPVMGDDGQHEMDDEGQPKMKVLYEGDVAIDAASPWDVMYDFRVRQHKNHKWHVIRTFRNKYDLAARYPQFADQIIALSSRDPLGNDKVMPFSPIDFESEDDNDTIPVYEFYHLRTDAVPNGRYTLFFDEKIVPYDGPFQYRERLPIFRITPGEIFESSECYTDAFDVLVLQQVYNVLESTAFSNQQAFGGQVIWMPEGANVTSNQLGKWLTVLKGGQPDMKPEVLQLLSTPPEVFKNKEMIENSMEKLMGINSVVRGDPDHGLKSGIALGRLQAMAIQYSSNFQQSWAELQEDCGTFLLNLLQDFAKTERMVALAGKSNKGAMVSFTGEKLNKIQRVVVDLGNPLARTVAGRMEMADTLLGKGMIHDPRAYLTLIETGQFEQAMEGEESRELLVRKENEDLRDGKPVHAMVGDPHLFHIQEHLAVMADPMVRGAQASGDPLAMKITQAALTHIQWHEFLRKTQDPIWSQVCNEPPVQPIEIPQGPVPDDQTQPPPKSAPPPPPPMPGPPGMPGPGGPPPGPPGPPGPPPSMIPGMHGHPPPPHGAPHGHQGPPPGVPPSMRPPDPQALPAIPPLPQAPGSAAPPPLNPVR
jgi:hypothetical protein